MKSIKKDLIFAVIMLIVGIGLLIAGTIIELIGHEANNSFFGIGCGFSVAGLISTIKLKKYMKDPEKCEEIEIAQTEERTVFLRTTTNSTVYSIFIYVEVLLVIIASFLGNKSILFILSALLISKLITWFIICSMNAKKY